MRRETNHNVWTSLLLLLLDKPYTPGWWFSKMSIDLAALNLILRNECMPVCLLVWSDLVMLEASTSEEISAGNECNMTCRALGSEGTLLQRTRRTSVYAYVRMYDRQPDNTDRK